MTQIFSLLTGAELQKAISRALSSALLSKKLSYDKVMIRDRGTKEIYKEETNYRRESKF